MRVFIDTNIFLDLLLKRKSYEESLMILNAVEKGMFKGFILDITLLNIDYIAKKQVKDIRDFLRVIAKLFHISSASNRDILEAIDIKNDDLEDTLQYICAKNCKSEAIVTNDKNFYSPDIAVYSSEEFLKRYIRRLM